MASPTAAASDGAAQHRHPPEPVEQRNPGEAAGGHGDREDAEHQGALSVVESAVVDEADRDPVVRRALGEGHPEHEQPDEQRARVEPDRHALAEGRPLLVAAFPARASSRGIQRTTMNAPDDLQRADDAQVHARRRIPANAASEPRPAPVTVPKLQLAWNQGMMLRPLARSDPAPETFIATSQMPLVSP